MAGLAIGGKGKGEAENEAPPVDVQGPAAVSGPRDRLFYIAAVVAVLEHADGRHARNLVHALLYLVISLFAVAVVFYTLGAPFVAALEVIVYAGAIMMLFLFAVMLLNVSADVAGARAAPRVDRAGDPRGRPARPRSIYGLTRQSQRAGRRARSGRRR